MPQIQNDPDDPNSLSSNVVWSILQDRRGNLWIGTLGGGLNRLDKETNTWRQYRNDPSDPYSLSNNNVSAIYQDCEAVLWVGTLGGGLDRFDREAERFTHFPSGPDNLHSLGNPFVYSILEDREGRLWIATDEGAYGGLHRFDRETGRFTHFRDGLSSNWVRALYEDQSGVLWISVVGAGLNRFDPITESHDRYQHDPNDPNSLSHDSVTTIHEDREGVLWLGTSGGRLNRLDPESETFVHLADVSFRDTPTACWAALVKPGPDTRRGLERCGVKRCASPTLRSVRSMHLFAYRLANCVIHRGRIAPSWCAIVLNGHNLDSVTLKQANFIDGNGISTGGNA